MPEPPERAEEPLAAAPEPVAPAETAKPFNPPRLRPRPSQYRPGAASSAQALAAPAAVSTGRETQSEGCLAPTRGASDPNAAAKATCRALRNQQDRLEEVQKASQPEDARKIARIRGAQDAELQRLDAQVRSRTAASEVVRLPVSKGVQTDILIIYGDPGQGDDYDELIINRSGFPVTGFSTGGVELGTLQTGELIKMRGGRSVERRAARPDETRR